MLTDLAGAIAQVFSFDAYGNMRAVYNGTGQFIGTDANDALTTMLYGGQQLDPRTAMEYLRGRYYDPMTGRFNADDPFFGISEDPQSFHRYVYAHDNPVNLNDPNGTFDGLTAQQIQMAIQVTLVALNVYSFYTNWVGMIKSFSEARQAWMRGHFWDGTMWAVVGVMHLGLAALSLFGIKSALMPPPAAPGLALATNAGTTQVYRAVAVSSDFAAWASVQLGRALANALASSGMLLMEHHVDWTLRDGNGRFTGHQGEEVSGSDIANPGNLSWPEQLRTHTEYKLIDLLWDIFQPGQTLWIEGILAPCQSCRTWMEMAAATKGIRIIYFGGGRPWIFQ